MNITITPWKRARSFIYCSKYVKVQPFHKLSIVRTPRTPCSVGFQRLSITHRYSRQHGFLSSKHSSNWPIRQYLAVNKTPNLAEASIGNSPPAAYTVPETGVLSILPKTLVPYAELSRLEKPAGSAYLLMPCAFSTLLAACAATPSIPVLSVISTIGLFTLGATSMRGAGCTINDLYDRKLDRLVTRTKLRPLARGAVSVPAAITWAGAQCLLGAVVLLQFPPNTVFLALPSMLLVCTYPLAKRVTQYPQFVLGMAFSWGAFLGFPALGINMVDFHLKIPNIEAAGTQTTAQMLSWETLYALPSALSDLHISVGDSRVLASAGLLYASCIAWTLLYDTIYAFQDIRDDRNAGIKSTAQAFSTRQARNATPASSPEAPLSTSYPLNASTFPPEQHIIDRKPKMVLSSLLVVQTALLASSGYVLGLGPAFYVLSCGGCASTLALMIRRVDLQDVKSCAWWFRMGCWITGGAIGLGLGAEYAIRRMKDEEELGHQLRNA